VAKANARWQFWLDVGGTFTDCVARDPNGRLHRFKTLSSGVTKGVVAAVSSREVIAELGSRVDPPDIWRGFRIKIFGRDGELFAERHVKSSSSPRPMFLLSTPLDADPPPGARFELDSGEEAPLVAIRYLLGVPLDQALPPIEVRLGTTRGTNALLTRRGAPTAFVTTRGFGDILRIGYQNRPRLFELAIQKPTPLFQEVVEIDERLAIDGKVIERLDENTVRWQLRRLRDRRPDVDSLAICLLNGYCQPTHEQRVAALGQEAGFRHVSVSHEIAPLIKLVARGDTTVVDAYLSPLLADYVASLRRALGPETDLRLLTSAGGLVEANAFRGKDSILSGPAGGVVGCSRVALAAGFDRAIGFDMGGTSTDVSRFDGRYEREFETEKAGVRIVSPMMAIETVAAGGGSICGFDGVKLTVGPDSAGADPGPACYGRGGPLTITDVNLWLRRVSVDHFPFPLVRDAVARRLGEMADQILQATGTKPDLFELARGYIEVANSHMARAIRSVSLAKGCDPRDYVLVAFGGAAAQHACAVADELGITRVLSHPDAGLLSAYGIGLAEPERHRMLGVYRPYSTHELTELEPRFLELEDATRRELVEEGAAIERVATRRSLDLRYRGLDAFLTIDQPADGDYGTAYEAEHRRRFGYAHLGRPLEIVAIRVNAVAPAVAALPPSTQVTPVDVTEDNPVATYERVKLQPGHVVRGPALIVESYSTNVVDAGWQASMLTGRELLLERWEASPESAAKVSQDETTDSSLHSAARIYGFSQAIDPAGLDGQQAVSPVLLEVFNGRFQGIAEQMGVTLRNTATSVNVKERLDFSCAIFTADGDLVVNAPHIPVHLGAMGETVRQLLRQFPQLSPGDVLITNDPYAGGSHLPDVTVVTPVHDPATGARVFLTASRAHHAEIGGITPGSMPPFSRNLAEEGVLLRGFKLVEGGESRFDELRRRLSESPYPSRAIEDNLTDVAAQVAANRQGQRDLERLVDRYGLDQVVAYMGHIQKAAETKTRRALARLPAGRREFRDHLDDGTPICVAVEVHGDSVRIDFSGTGQVLKGNLNANRAIVSAAILYVLRCLIAEEIPLNQGVLAPVQLVLPPCLLNPTPGATPAESPAVVGGNVETSQRVVDVLLGAFGLAAASQGTMNNLLFGDGTFGYYETICGGSGATAMADGADAVHTHMTNTRLTDPEVLERRFPVRVEEFSIRKNSGGAGRFRGGHGIVRRLRFLRPLTISLLTQRRGPYAPYGVQGGQPGSLGQNRLRRLDAAWEQLPNAVQCEVQAGDELEIRTPGGGGWGPLP
jgi:5-oxoprolinase (ATP-hydrolysing)